MQQRGTHSRRTLAPSSERKERYTARGSEVCELPTYILRRVAAGAELNKRGRWRLSTEAHTKKSAVAETHELLLGGGGGDGGSDGGGEAVGEAGSEGGGEGGGDAPYPVVAGRAALGEPIRSRPRPSMLRCGLRRPWGAGGVASAGAATAFGEWPFLKRSSHATRSTQSLCEAYSAA